MTARVIYNIGTHVVERLEGDEVFVCRSGETDRQGDHGGKLAALFRWRRCRTEYPSRGGAHAAVLSELPNAEFEMHEGDLVTGLRNGNNVNFSRMQIAAPLVKAIAAMMNYDTALKSYAVSNLPNNITGMEAFVIDGAPGLGWGDRVTSGGTTIYKVWYNGKMWTVTGK
jgi:hypothetical protein